MKKKVSIGERSFTLFNNTFLILLALICIVPFLNIIATFFLRRPFLEHLLFRLVLQVSERSSVCVQLH
ncbi:hypothetical protein OGS_02702 [Enterococcus faecium EnGen0002]|nr:hypothetical protein OGS_02702 [Enterococcus faecium EnGen0002]